VEPRLPDEAGWAALAEIAEIPQKGPNRQLFRDLLSGAICFAHEHHGNAGVRVINRPSASEVEELESLADRADGLYLALNRARATKDPVRYILEDAVEPGSFSKMRTLRNDLSRAATNARATIRRRPIKDNVVLCRFLAAVLGAVDEAGGRLTLDKNHPRNRENVKPGNLLQFLDRLRRYLPLDFLPRKHPISLYSRVKRDWSRNRANRTEIPA
jgi:hypothetical protein